MSKAVRTCLCVWAFVLAGFCTGGCPQSSGGNTSAPMDSNAADAPDQQAGDTVQAERAAVDPRTLDDDGDGLTNGREAELGTNSQHPDSDGDGLNDADEVRRGTDPLKGDTDGDGVTDTEEVRAGTNPLAADTDTDGLSDLAERNAGTNPLLADTDSDGLLDGAELTRGTNPLLFDTDGDGIGDGLEVAAGLDPSVANVVATVGRVYCDGAIVLAGADGANVWYDSSSAVLGSWQVGDLVVLQRDPGFVEVATLTNVSRGGWRIAVDYGILTESGTITGPLVSQWNGWSTDWYLPVDGTMWPLNPNDSSKVLLWDVGDQVIISYILWHTSSGDLDMWHVIHLGECENALLSP